MVLHNGIVYRSNLVNFNMEIIFDYQTKEATDRASFPQKRKEPGDEQNGSSYNEKTQ